MGSKDEDEDGEDKDSKAVTESFHRSGSGTSDLRNIKSALVVGGYPTSMRHDPTTQVLEGLEAMNVEAAMVQLASEEASVPEPSRSAVYNTDPEEIFSGIRETYERLGGETLVIGYCAGGVYALESLGEIPAFVGMDVPSGIENYYTGELSPGAPENSVFLYDQEMNGRIETSQGREFNVSGTTHLWRDTPEDLGEAAIYLGEAASSGDSDTRIQDLASTYDWLDGGGDIPVENPEEDATPASWSSPI